MIHDLKRQGLSITAIARQAGLDRKTVRRYLARGIEPPAYKKRAPVARLITPFEAYLRGRVAAYPDLSATRLMREIREQGYRGGYTGVGEFVREIRPPRRAGFERRFETPPGRQAQVDFAEFKVSFEAEPGVARKVWLFALVLGHSRWLWGRFCAGQDLRERSCAATSRPSRPWAGRRPRCSDGRMKTAVIGESPEGVVTYNTSLVGLLGHYGAAPRACRPYRAKTKGKVERPYRYIRQDFFLARSFRDLEDLNAQFDEWRVAIANPRVHATTGRVVEEHFAAEKPSLIPLPVIPYSAVLTVERRLTKDGMISVAGNQYSVPDSARRRSVEVSEPPHRDPHLRGRPPPRQPPGARGPRPATGRSRASQDPPPASAPSELASEPTGVARRPLGFYDAVGRRLAAGGAT